MHAGDRRLRPHNLPHQAALNCPRCDSLNTKFCYYNNYNLSQPRYFCKNCRRYWTKGGVLRNVPVGGSCRKTNRSKPKPKLKPTNSHSSTDSSSAVIRVPESGHQIGDNMFTSEIVEFADLMSTYSDPLGLVGAAETAMLDPTVGIDDLTEKGGGNGGVDWEGGGLFDIQYWNETTSFHTDQWCDDAHTDIPLFLP